MNVFKKYGTKGSAKSKSKVDPKEAYAQLVKEAKANGGSLMQALNDRLEHDGEYGIENIEYLIPDVYNNLHGSLPMMIDTMDEQWVNAIYNGVTKANGTRVTVRMQKPTDRAYGYQKGAYKHNSQVEPITSFSVTPTTIYKKQKFNRDDLIDVEPDLIGWVKSEMQVMIRAEIARAILFGDGRDTDSEDHINTSKVKPIMMNHNDDTTYFWGLKESETKEILGYYKNEYTEYDLVQLYIDCLTKSLSEYRGSGNPILFLDAEVYATIKYFRDSHGTYRYMNESDIASEIGCGRIIPVRDWSEITGVWNSRAVELGRPYYPIEMEDESEELHYPLGVFVNPTDYRLGLDEGGKLTWFEKFDIDYNQKKYLLETRCSGTLTGYHQAVVVYMPGTKMDAPPTEPIKLIAKHNLTHTAGGGGSMADTDKYEVSDLMLGGSWREFLTEHYAQDPNNLGKGELAIFDATNGEQDLTPLALEVVLSHIVNDTVTGSVPNYDGKGLGFPDFGDYGEFIELAPHAAYAHAIPFIEVDSTSETAYIGWAETYPSEPAFDKGANIAEYMNFSYNSSEATKTPAVIIWDGSSSNKFVVPCEWLTYIPDEIPSYLESYSFEINAKATLPSGRELTTAIGAYFQVA